MRYARRLKRLVAGMEPSAMSFRFAAILAGLTLMLPAPVSQAQVASPVPSTGAVVELELTAGTPVLEPFGDGEVRVVIPDFGALERPARPELPWATVDVALPPDLDPSRVRLEVDAVTEDLPGSHRVVPAPPAVAREEGQSPVYDWLDAEDVVDGRDRAVYDVDAVYPARVVEVTASGRLRQWRYLRLAFYPVRYRPQSGRLLYHPRVTVRLHRTPADLAAGGRVESLVLPDTVMTPQVSRRFVNVEQATAWYRPAVPPALPGLTPAPPSAQTDYVVVTTESVVAGAGAALDIFLEHKRRLGHRVDVITEDDYGRSSSEPRQHQIREWLRQNYLQRGIRWVLLIGHPHPDLLAGAYPPDAVPMFPAQADYRGLPGSEISPTDYYYADLTGTWDLDGDGLYGERRHKPVAEGPEKQVLSSPYSVRWTGKLALDAGDHTLCTASDDGLRLRLDGDVKIDHWSPHSGAWDETEVNCPRQRCEVDLEIEYRRQDGDGVAGLYWKPPEAPMCGVASGRFAVRWSGRLKVERAGRHRLRTRSDDGVRLALRSCDDAGDTWLIDDWQTHPVQPNEATVDLPVGNHELCVEYFENGGAAIMRLEWQPPGASTMTPIAAENLQFRKQGQWHDGGLLGEYYHSADGRRFHARVGEQVDAAIDFEWSRERRKPVPSERLTPAACGGLSKERGLCGEYFKGDQLRSLVWRRIDPDVDFYWGAGDAGDDGADVMPEVYVGRIPVYERNYTELAHILDKIRRYEDVTYVPAWRRRALLAMDELDPITPGYKMGEDLIARVLDPQGFDTGRIYDRDFSLLPPPERTPCSQDNTLELWNPDDGPGRGLVVFSAHGGPSGAGHVLTSDRCTDLDDDQPSFVVQMSCLNGLPERADNLGYRLLSHGGIATFSGSRNLIYLKGEWREPNPASSFGRQLAFHVAQRLAEGESAGEALYETSSMTAYSRNNLRLNLYGDPAISLLRVRQIDIPVFDWRVSLRVGSILPDDVLSDFRSGPTFSLELERVLGASSWLLYDVRYARLEDRTDPSGDVDLAVLGAGVEWQQPLASGRLFARQRAGTEVYLPDISDPELGFQAGLGLSWQLRQRWQLTLDVAYHRSVSGDFAFGTTELGVAYSF